MRGYLCTAWKWVCTAINKKEDWFTCVICDKRYAPVKKMRVRRYLCGVLYALRAETRVCTAPWRHTQAWARYTVTMAVKWQRPLKRDIKAKNISCISEWSEWSEWWTFGWRRQAHGWTSCSRGSRSQSRWLKGDPGKKAFENGSTLELDKVNSANLLFELWSLVFSVLICYRICRE